MFSDGESVVSSFEYDFSKILRSFGLVYNQDYFRNIKYSDIYPEYDGLMNCDYLLVKDNHKLYIELAGMLAGKSDSEAFLNDIIIEDKPYVEDYRLKLVQKKQIFELTGLDYLIICGKDLNHDYFERIINNCYSD